MSSLPPLGDALPSWGLNCGSLASPRRRANHSAAVSLQSSSPHSPPAVLLLLLSSFHSLFTFLLSSSYRRPPSDILLLPSSSQPPPAHSSLLSPTTLLPLSSLFPLIFSHSLHSKSSSSSSRCPPLSIFLPWLSSRLLPPGMFFAPFQPSSSYSLPSPPPASFLPLPPSSRSSRLSAQRPPHKVADAPLDSNAPPRFFFVVTVMKLSGSHEMGSHQQGSGGSLGKCFVITVNGINVYLG